MNSQQLKIVPIGNSRGIRLSKSILTKYGFSQEITALETQEGLLLYAPEKDRKLGLEETFAEMARSGEDWSDFEAVVADGLD